LSTAVLVTVSLSACASFGRKPSQPDLEAWPEIRGDYRVEALRTRLREYSISFAAAVDLTATAIERRTTDATVKRNALLWKLGAIPEMREACFRPEPVAALVDAWTFVRQMDHLFREGPAATAFGTFQPEAQDVTRRLVLEIRAISDSIATSPDARAELERQIVDAWVVEHPLHDLTFIRESPIAQFAEQSRRRGDAIQSVGTIEQVVSSLSHQARIYIADLPRQVRGEIDLLRSDLLPPELLASIQGDLRLGASAAASIAATGEAIPGLVSRERQAVLDEVSHQRALVLAAITLEREQAVGAMLRAFSLERERLLRDVDTQRRATLEWATSERGEAVAALRQELAGTVGVLRDERAIVVNDLRHIVDMVLLRLALAVTAAVILAPFIAHVYARVWPRQ
jgi:hypothetical protein